MLIMKLNDQDLLGIPSLRDILLYHVIGGGYFTSDHLDSGTWPALFTLNQQSIDVDYPTLTSQQGAVVNIVLADLQARNGSI